MMYLAYVAATFLAMTSMISAHSWVACTDYRGDINYYQEDKCFGYPRHWSKRGSNALSVQSKGYQIGVDTGYEYKPTQNAACQYPMSKPYNAAYTSQYPMATYETGGVYCLAWPTKNHAAATCTNQFIPDNQLKLFISKANPGSDPSQSAFRLRNINGFSKCQNSNSNECTLGKRAHVKGSVDCEGFQRSPKFCENTDKALAHACFEVPSWLPKGHYVLQWYWEFNSGEFYSTCWDAQVVGAGKAPKRSVSPGTKGSPQTTLCQGGFGGPGDCKCNNNYWMMSRASLRSEEVEYEPEVEAEAEAEAAVEVDMEMEMEAEMEMEMEADSEADAEEITDIQYDE